MTQMNTGYTMERITQIQFLIFVFMGALLFEVIYARRPEMLTETRASTPARMQDTFTNAGLQKATMKKNSASIIPDTP